MDYARMNLAGQRAESRTLRDAIGFADRVVAVLDEGAFTVTHKHAVPLGLLDEMMERTSAKGEPRSVVSAASTSMHIGGRRAAIGSDMV